MSKFGRGIRRDLAKRIPLYLDDWKQGWNIHVISSTIFMYFASIGPAITFAAALHQQTNGNFGVIEVILSTALCGILYSILSGQPLVIVGVSGPVSIFSSTVYLLSQSFQIDFLKWYAWILFWTGAWHFVLASANACDFLIGNVTRFTCDTFGFLISVIYIATACLSIYSRFYVASLEIALLGLFLALLTLWLTTLLSRARSWHIFVGAMRCFLNDYGTVISLATVTLISYAGKFHIDNLDRLPVPLSFVTSSNRPWVVDFWNLPVKHIFTALVPATFFAILLYFDHNVSSLLAQHSEFNLKKPNAYHWDYLVVGICLIMCGILQIPPSHGLIPQAPMHVVSLAKVKPSLAGHPKYTNVIENRVSNLSQSCLIGLTLCSPFLYVLSLIPLAVLDGFFLFMGVSSFQGNQLWQRLLLLITSTEQQMSICHHRFTKSVSYTSIAKFTFIQFVICMAIFGITETAAAITFPLLIVVLVPVRMYIFPRIFGENELLDLDSEAILPYDDSNVLEEVGLEAFEVEAAEIQGVFE